MDNNNINGSTCQEVFKDHSESGRLKPWREHKMGSRLLARVYEELGDTNKALRVHLCADFMKFVVVDGKNKLIQGSFCHVRLCQMCQWKRSGKVGFHLRRVMEHMRNVKDYRYLLLTLTLRNCSAENLGRTINLMMHAWDKFMKRKDIRRAFKGTLRSLEVTHNLDEVGTELEYHCHFHVLVVVNPSYFTSSDYISQKRYVELWRESLVIDYEPVVDVRPVWGSSFDELLKVIPEVAKYSTKSNEVLIEGDWELTCDTVMLLDRVFHRRRFVAWGGVLKDVKEELGIGDEESNDLNDDVDVVIEDKDVKYVKWFDNYNQYYYVDL